MCNILVVPLGIYNVQYTSSTSTPALEISQSYPSPSMSHHTLVKQFVDQVIRLLVVIHKGRLIISVLTML